MKRIISIISAFILLVSCSQEDVLHSGKATLILDVSRENVPQASVTRAVSSVLAIQILTPDGSVYQEYQAGSVPDKVILDAGVVYTIRAFSPNQGIWQNANDGRGEACYYGETSVTAVEDEVVYCRYKVPMTNYAVTFTLPELFDQLFSTYSLSLQTVERNVVLTQAETKAYFSVDDKGFTYQLQATNNDGKTSRHSEIEYPEVAAGKLYNIKYVYASDFNTGGIDIDIEDNTEHEDVDIEI